MRLLELGPDAEMAKVDIRSAYRIVPVHPQDRHLLGVMWDGKLYVDAALPFGLRSAPKIFNAVADALQWMAEQHGIHDIWHYQDDYITCGARDSGECGFNLQMLLDICRHLGIPLAEEKIEGPTTCLTFLGIELDSTHGQVRLPQDKLRRLKQALQEWQQKKRCTKRELLSIAGKLQHAATVVKSGRTFVRRLFELSIRVKKLDHHLKLNAWARSDIEWWAQFVEEWNVISLLSMLGALVPTTTLTSDASGSWGCGAFWEEKWFQLAWSESPGAVAAGIAAKELIPIVLAAAMWGKMWTGEVVNCRCDNSAVVAVIRSRTSKDPSLMHLLRCMIFFEAKYCFSLVASHIAGIKNTLADDLSRNHLSSFLQARGTQSITGKCIPPTPLVNLLINSRQDWDICKLEEDVQRYFEDGLASSTRKMYQTGINRFYTFCNSYSIHNPLPASESTLCLFVSHLANNGLARGTVKTYMSAVRYLHIIMQKLSGTKYGEHAKAKTG